MAMCCRRGRRMSTGLLSAACPSSSSGACRGEAGTADGVPCGNPVAGRGYGRLQSQQATVASIGATFFEAFNVPVGRRRT